MATPDHTRSQDHSHTRGVTHHEHAGHHSHGGHDAQHAHHGHRHGAFNPAVIDRLLGEQRLAALPPEQTLRTAGLTTGQTVVDLGCGPGYFTLPAAGIVGPRGTVYGVDVQPEMVEVCRQRATEAGVHNVKVHLSAGSQVPLPDGIAGIVLVSLVLHEVEDPVALLREARRLLAPGGEVAVIELPKDVGPPGAPRLSAEEVASATGAAGLSVRQQQNLDGQHLLYRLSMA
jgi:SAM-dependent methyltransferase